MDEKVKAIKREQHNTYYTFLAMMCVIVAGIGAVGLIGYFSTNKISFLLTAAIGIIVSILLITSDKVKSRMIYPIRGE